MYPNNLSIVIVMVEVLFLFVCLLCSHDQIQSVSLEHLFFYTNVWFCRKKKFTILTSIYRFVGHKINSSLIILVLVLVLSNQHLRFAKQNYN
jgi:hypothetical protein